MAWRLRSFDTDSLGSSSRCDRYRGVKIPQPLNLRFGEGETRNPVVFGANELDPISHRVLTSHVREALHADTARSHGVLEVPISVCAETGIWFPNIRSVCHRLQAGFDVLAREHGALRGNATKTWAVLEASLATATRVPADDS